MRGNLSNDIVSIKIEEPGWILWTGACEEKRDQADENIIFDNYDEINSIVTASKQFYIQSI